MVNRKNVRKLVAALRGGKYHQTNAVLCRKKGTQTFHCCLGVSCRLAIKDGIKLNIENVVYGTFHQITFDGHRAMPPSSVRAWLGDDVNCNELAEMNDDGKSFREIADFLEKRYL